MSRAVYLTAPCFDYASRGEPTPRAAGASARPGRLRFSRRPRSIVHTSMTQRRTVNTAHSLSIVGFRDVFISCLHARMCHLYSLHIALTASAQSRAIYTACTDQMWDSKLRQR
eukprot:7052441-Prymnesium_polylepis.2